ncbi:hypothetical protein SGPA1_10936 [Streptomyces misionensis JCM 4497]
MWQHRHAHGCEARHAEQLRRGRPGILLPDSTRGAPHQGPAHVRSAAAVADACRLVERR